MKDINKARYSFLSGKIAYQRAYAELQKKLLMRAEEKRINLRKRQEEFQRVVFRTKMHLKRIYGREYLEKPKRILKTTACKLGSPEFTSNMIKLGYLPPKFNVSPEKLKEGGVVYYKNSSQIPEKSQNSISQWNFPQNFEKTKSEKANQKLLRLKSLCKIQSRIKG